MFDGGVRGPRIGFFPRSSFVGLTRGNGEQRVRFLRSPDLGSRADLYVLSLVKTWGRDGEFGKQLCLAGDIHRNI
jgi:hypothetical protein